MLSVLIFVLLIFSSASELISAESQKLDRVRIGYSSISSSRIALWVTSEMDFFRKNGLAAETIVTPGVQGTQALIAGELQFYLGGVDSAALAVSRGSDLVALATAEPIEYKLIAQPEIKTVKELRGKKIVVDRVGGTSYYISLQILEKVGLKSADVELVQVGGGGNQRVAAFKSGLVAGVVTSPDRFEQMKIPYLLAGYATSRSYLATHRLSAVKFMRGLMKSIKRIKSDRPYAERILGQYIKSNDAELLRLALDQQVRILPDLPYAPEEGMKTILEDLSRSVPEARRLPPSALIDNTVVSDALKSRL